MADGRRLAAGPPSWAVWVSPGVGCLVAVGFGLLGYEYSATVAPHRSSWANGLQWLAVAVLVTAPYWLADALPRTWVRRRLLARLLCLAGLGAFVALFASIATFQWPRIHAGDEDALLYFLRGVGLAVVSLVALMLQVWRAWAEWWTYMGV